jgi:hypothetical protein
MLMAAGKPLHATRQACQACITEPYVTARLAIKLAERETFCFTCAVELDAKGLLAIASARRVSK